MNLYGHIPIAPRVAVVVAVLFLAAGRVSSAQTTESGKPDKIIRGKAALSDGLHEVAEDQFRSFLADSADDEESRNLVTILLIRSLHAQGKYDEIAEVLDSTEGNPETGAFTFWRAMSEHSQGRNEEALVLLDGYEDSFEKDEYAARVERLRASCFLALGRIDDAIASFERFDRDFSKSPEASENRLIWGKTLVSHGRPEEAEQILADLATVPVDGDEMVIQGILWLGRARRSIGKFSEAGKTLDRLCGSESVTGDMKAEAWLERGEVYVAMTNVQKAVNSISNAISLARSPDLKGRGAVRLGWLHLDTGNLKQGIPLLKEFISAFPGDPLGSESQLRISFSYLETNGYEAAVNEFQYYLETFADVQGQAQAYEGKGWALMELSRYAEAATAFTKGHGLYKDDLKREQCLLKAGDAYFSNRQYRLSREMYERVLAEFPSGKLRANASLQLGGSMIKSGDTVEAERVLRRTITEYPGTPLAEEAIYKVALLKESLEEWREAVDVYSEMIDSHTNGLLAARALHGRGMVRYRLFRFKEAVNDFERVVELYPESKSSEQAFYMRGLCYYGLMRDEDAVKTCEAFIKEYPDSSWIPDVLFWMAKYSFNSADYGRAEKEFLQTVEKKSDSPLADDALLWAGISSAKGKEYLRANEHFSRLVKDYPASALIPEARFEQANVLCELAHFAAAILIYDEIITKYPESDFVSAAWGRKGDCQFMLGADDAKRYEESIASFRVVANSSGTRLALVMQAEYKVGRCLEKQGKADEALDQYYLKVIIRYFEDREKGIWHGENSKVWFTRAAFKAADIMEERKDWRGVVSILDRVAKAGVPAADEARERIERIKSERWWLF